jgi:hypothetical protein
MRDWTGSRIREDALRHPCRYCHAIAGQQCVTRDENSRPLEAFPAHEVRIRDAQKPKEEV